MLKENKGIITIPFLLVMIIILSFILSFFGLAMTFAHVSVTQYLTYSSARKFALAGESQEDQMRTSKNHYEKLRGRFFKSSAHTGKTGDWFYIPEEISWDRGGSSNFGDPEGYTDGASHPTKNTFYGISVNFRSFIIQLQIPFLTDGGDEDAPEIRVLSFLGREVSKEECEIFNAGRYEKIKAEYNSINNIENFVSGGDNGC